MTQQQQQQQQPGDEFKIGSRVTIIPVPPVEYFRTGTLRFISDSVKFATGEWMGIELDLEFKGRNNGAVEGTKYFDCEREGQGIFVRSELVKSFSGEAENNSSSASSVSSAAAGSMIALELRSQIERLKERISSSDKRVAELRETVEILNVDVEIAKEEKLIVQDELEFLKKRIEIGSSADTLGTPAEHSTSVSATSATSAAQEKNSKKNNNSNNSLRLAAASEAAVRRIQRLDQRVILLQQSNNKYESQLEEINEKLEFERKSNNSEYLRQLTEAKLQLQAHLEQRVSENEKLRKEVEELEGLSDAQSEELSQQEQLTIEIERVSERRLNTLQEQLRKTIETTERLRFQVSSLERELENLSQQDSLRESALAMSQDAISEAHNRNKEQLRELEEMNRKQGEEIQGLEDKLEEKESAHRASLESLHIELNGKREEANKLQSQLSESSVQVAELRKNESEARLARERMIVMSRELETERESHEKTRKKLAASEKDFNEAIRVLEQRLAASKAELKKAQQQK